MAKIVVSVFRNCTQCYHGKKKLWSRTCKPCILGYKNNFKMREKPWKVKKVKTSYGYIG